MTIARPISLVEAKPISEKLSAGLILLLAAFSAHSAEPAVARIYCCEGGRICADSLPEQCRGKAYRILDSGGNLLKEIGPPLTAQQKAEHIGTAAKNISCKRRHQRYVARSEKVQQSDLPEKVTNREMLPDKNKAFP